MEIKKVPVSITGFGCRDIAKTGHFHTERSLVVSLCH